MRRMGTRGNMNATSGMGGMGSMGGMRDMGSWPERAQCGQPPEHGRPGNMGTWAARTAMAACPWRRSHSVYPLHPFPTFTTHMLGADSSHHRREQSAGRCGLVCGYLACACAFARMLPTPYLRAALFVLKCQEMFSVLLCVLMPGLPCVLSPCLLLLPCCLD